MVFVLFQTVTNINTTTQASTGRRRRRHISKLEVDYYPNGTEEIIDQITKRLSRALLRFDKLKSSSS